MKNSLLIVLGLSVGLGLGCARVRVEAPKEPIRLDVSMRLDIYQHIEKDIDAIENMVSGSPEKPKGKDKQSLLSFFVGEAYAEEGLAPEVQEAALRRKDRRSDMVALLANGVIGENKSGLVQIRNSQKADSQSQSLVEAENKDRMIIYQAVAEKNGSSLEEVKKLYAKRLQADAPSGSPVEVAQGAGSYAWENKP